MKSKKARKNLAKKSKKRLIKKKTSSKPAIKKKAKPKKTRKSTVKKVSRKSKPAQTKKASVRKSKAAQINKAAQRPVQANQPQILLKEQPGSVNVKFYLGAKDTPQPSPRYKLPEKYNDDKMAAMFRDPWWIHTYWDLSKNRIQSVLNIIPSDERKSLKRILRVYELGRIKSFNGSNFKSYFDIEINDSACNWYLNVNKPGESFCVEIGLLSGKGNFYMLCRSNIVSTPAFGISDIINEEWILPEEEYYKILGIYDMGRSSLERKRRFEEIFKKQVSSFGGSETFSAGIRKKIKRKFFLEAATELIIYGRTEPDASLFFQGKKINLKPDGTFSVRMGLPIGKFEFPIKAVSYSQKDTLAITPTVERSQK